MCRDVSCMKCGTKFSPCIMTGRAILDDNYVRCKVCRHKAGKADIRAAKNCPLCHAPLPKAMPAATAGPIRSLAM